MVLLTAVASKHLPPGRQRSASAVVNEKGHFLPGHGFANIFFFSEVLMVNLGTK